ncbi:MAG: hypothetical protein QG574_27, partial [Cyanobacteriota bacterium erpe_2018_sw_21hr_WHONDRS-SW48-000092_B_bin.40]|nr:hypothetical protein [Cyanobacteriota bacterium erpe_2018_sw_21hr_WHONDRS-SW48-000092_B_bin.40]
PLYSEYMANTEFLTFPFILPYTLTGIGPSEVASASFPIRRAATGVSFRSRVHFFQ